MILKKNVSPGIAQKFHWSKKASDCRYANFCHYSLPLPIPNGLLIHRVKKNILLKGNFDSGGGHRDFIVNDNISTTDAVLGFENCL